MYKHTLIALAVGVLGLTGSAHAQNLTSNGFSYTYAEVGYGMLDASDTVNGVPVAFSPTGAGFNAQILVSDEIYISLGAVSATADSINVNSVRVNVDTKFSSTNIGAGYRFAINDTTDASVGFSSSSAKGTATINGVVTEATVDATSLDFGIKTRLSPKGVATLSASYVMPKGGTGEMGYGADYEHEVAKDIGAFIGYAKSGDVTSTTFGVRLHF